MKKLLAQLFVLCAIIVNFASAQAPENYAENRLIAQLKSPAEIYFIKANSFSFAKTELMDLLIDLNVSQIQRLTLRKNTLVEPNEPILLLFDQATDIPTKISELMSTGLFQFVEPDYIGFGDGVCSELPNDTYFASRQWGLKNDGTLNINSVVDADIDMENGWSITTGDSTIIVGVLDTGLKFDHPELAGRIWSNPGEIPGNGTDDDGNGLIDDKFGWDFVNNDNNPTDDQGHGTNVTGIIGANANNNLGYAGVDWECKLMVGKVLNSSNNGVFSWWISGIYYMVDNGADVINMSMGGFFPSAPLETAVNYAYANNVPITVSMGNENGVNPLYPAGYPNVIAVGATDTDNERVSPFTWGGGSNYGSHIDICAPGNIIYGLSYTSNTNYDSFWGGTSQAAPLVAGVVSLIRGLNYSLSIDSIKTLLYTSAIDLIGDPSEDIPGWDQFHGHGLLNAYNTLLLANMGIDTQVRCAPYTWIDGNTYSANNNTATFLTTDAGGCDSLVKLNLTIVPGTTYGTDVQSACDEYTWMNGNTYYSSNNSATHTLVNAAGCDSIVTLNLTMAYSTSSTAYLVACDSLRWIDGITYYASNNSATAVLTNAANCDSIVYLNLTIRYSSTSSITETAMNSYTAPSGAVYTVSGIYTDVIPNQAGCDSTITINLTIVNTPCDLMAPTDIDGDTELCDTDCDDNDPTINNLDLDNDGVSSCGGDCNDNNANNFPSNTEICDGQDNNCNTIIDEAPDVDGDGITDCDGDCDDSDANNFPGNTEICDGQDNNCNNIIDEGSDIDNDGISLCAGDCDDNNPNNFPGNTEICDGQDNNCNTVIDEVSDLDGDGVTGCAGDCDDSDANNFPGNTEICDGQDNNCNNIIDEGSDIDNDGISLCAGDCDDNNPNNFPGNTEICDGQDNNCNTVVDEVSDIDGDGITGCAGDCDDSDANNFPGNTEICDGQDNNCNNIIDEGSDIDNDGISLCAGDCDDNNPNNFPGNTEICDGQDNNCNTVIDEVSDIDGDGITGCAGDCDDSDANNFPGNTEICDGQDNNCNNIIDEGSDIDNDGISLCGGDCDDNNPNNFPGNTEICDGQDNNCNTVIDEVSDLDGDGVTVCAGDCDDSDANNFPGNTEICDGQDNNCNNIIDEGSDIDNDGINLCAGDCDDNNPNNFPGNTEICDGQDNNCNTIIDEGFDADGDGVTSCEGDCNNNNPNNFPGNVEICDAMDNNCNATIDEGFDMDGDGAATCTGDCDDNDPNNYSGNGEVCDGQDNNCSGLADEGYDSDGDGVTICEGDCNDNNSNVYPGNLEICDGQDNNCNGLVNEGFDLDNDGVLICAGDCNDVNAIIYLGAPELCDGLDNDCNGLLPFTEHDFDNDSYYSCGGDCNDANPMINPSALEITCNGQDDDCNPLTPDDLGTPTALCQNVSVNLNATGTASITLAMIDAGTFDDCGIGAIWLSQSTFNCSHVGLNTITLNVLDDAGNSSSCTSTVTVVDNINPMPLLSSLPQISSPCQITSLTNPTVSDNCGGVTITHNATLPITAQGTTIITWTYTDASGNIATQTQSVFINDNIPPSPSVASLPLIISECAVTSLTPPIVTDNCLGPVTITHNAMLPITAQGTTLFTWTYTDAHGNSINQMQAVVIDDISAPVPIQATLIPVIGECEVLSLPAPPIAADNCNGIITATTTATGPWTDQGTYTITWTYNDGLGNISTQNQNIIIDDVTAPVPIVPVLSNLSALCSITPSPPFAIDECGGTITGTTNTVFPITNSSVITWEYNDGNGNISTQTQNVVLSGVDVSTTASPDGGTLSANNSSGSYQWINCATGLPMGGGSAQSYIATQNGNFAVIINQSGCIDTSACVNVSTVGLELLNSEHLQIYPNPSVNGRFSVTYSGQINSIKLFDLLGREMILPMEISTNEIDGSKLANGKYFIRVSTDDGVLTGEIVISQ